MNTQAKPDLFILSRTYLGYTAAEALVLNAININTDRAVPHFCFVSGGFSLGKAEKIEKMYNKVYVLKGMHTDSLIDQMKAQYPTLFYFSIEERNVSNISSIKIALECSESTEWQPIARSSWYGVTTTQDRSIVMELLDIFQSASIGTHELLVSLIDPETRKLVACGESEITNFRLARHLVVFGRMRNTCMSDNEKLYIAKNDEMKD
jgi:hypothetical protein